MWGGARRRCDEAKGAWLIRSAGKRAAAALALVWLPACQQVAPAPISAERGAADLDARSLADPALREFMLAELGNPPPASALGQALAEWPLERWDLDTLTLAALFHHSSLDVARAQWEVARGGIESAGARPNPTLALTPEYSFNPDTGASPWLSTVQLDWPIETAGKRGDRIERARALETAAHLELGAEAWRVRRALRDALIELAAARERGAGLAALVSTQSELAAALEQRRRAGAASEADAAPLRLALLRSQAQLGDAERQRLGALARVAAAVGVPVAALAGVELEFSLGAGPDPLAGVDETQARRSALLERSDVRAALDVYAASEAALRLELARQYPDLHLGTGYQFDQGQNKWGLGVFLELPLMNRNEGPIAEAIAARSEAAARFTALQAQVIAELEQALAERRGAVDQLARLDELIALQESQAERARSALALGAIDRPAQLATELELRSGELARVDARQALEQSYAALEAALQGPLLTPDALDRSRRLAAQGPP